MNSAQIAATYGPYAVVTGASDGIGKSAAFELASRGVGLVLVARREELLQGLAEDLRARYRVETRVVAADLGKRSGVAAVLAATAGCDVGLLVAAAGYGMSGPFVASDPESLRDMCEVNCGAIVDLTHAFARRFCQRGRGGIVLFGSLVGWQGAPHAAVYAASKAFVQTLGEGLMVELAPRGVDVLICAPGPVRSGFARRAAMVMGASDTPDQVARGIVRRLGTRGTLVPGVVGRLLTFALLLAPRRLRVQIMARIMRGMTRHREESPQKNQAAQSS